jgi:hypothetical protein
MDNTSIIQLATQQQNRLTILSNGNVGINTSNPSSKLHVVGTLTTTDLVNFKSTVNSTGLTNGSIIASGGLSISKDVFVGGKIRIYSPIPSTNINTGAFVITGGISIICNQNSDGFGNGGALTVAGGASIGGDLYVSGTINGSGSSSSTFAYLTLTATDEAVNFTSGSLVTLGGITIQCPTNANSTTDGGALLVEGGASINLDMYIGGNNYLYGQSNYYSIDDTILNFYDETLNKRFSIDKNFITNDFSISRYDTTGIFVEKSLDISNNTGNILFANSNTSTSSTTASLVLMGGVSINTIENAMSLTQGGALTIAGGASIAKDLFIGGNTVIKSTIQSNNLSSGSLVVNGGVGISNNVNIGGSLSVDNTITFNDKINYSGNGLFQTITNNDITNDEWYYFGQVTNYCEIEFKHDMLGLKIMVSVNDTTCTASHNYYGDSNDNMSSVFIYKTNNDYHLFVKIPAQNTTAIQVSLQEGNQFNIVSEGHSTTPDGTTSNFDLWTLYYSTTNHSNLTYNFGNVTSNGDTFKIADNMPIIGYNNTDTTDSRDLGIVFQRYQSSNDSGTGELVNDPYAVLDSLPDQSTCNINQIKFSNITDVNDSYYNGWWIKIGSGSNVNQVRKIVSYNGAQRVAYLDSPWTTENPTIGDTVYFYNSQYVSFYYNKDLRTFQLVYNTLNDKTISNYNFANLELHHLSLYDTTPSSNSSSGSICTVGGISIGNTTDSSSITEGGSFTTLGGASINKKLFVGDNIALGNNHFHPEESFHIYQETSTIRLENAQNTYSYIDFAEHTTSTRFGILSNSNTHQLSLTYNTSSNNPSDSNCGLVLTSNGYIGINTTSNINSPLSINSNNFISTNNDSGFLGIIAAHTNTNNTLSSGRMLVYGNEHETNAGDVIISAGTTGSIKLYTNEETELVNINQNGVVNIQSTHYTRSSTSGALIIAGGIAVSCSENAENVNNGGSLTVAGGASIQKDIWIGGNLYITGNLNAGGSVTQPDITFTGTVNCSINQYDDNNLVIVSNAGFFSFYVTITPTIESANCEFQYSLPGRTNAFIHRGELFSNCTAYTDDTELIPLFNVLSVGETGTTNGRIKFQSVSTAVHHFIVFCRYTIA